MIYKMISILHTSGSSVTKDEFSDSIITFSGNFAIIEESVDDYSLVMTFNLSDIKKIRLYKY